MKNRITSLVMLSSVLLFLCVSQVYSLNEDTHQVIDESIAGKTIGDFSLNSYLTNNLEFKGGGKELLWGVGNESGALIQRNVSWWLGYGGIQEDRPGSWKDYISIKPIRSNNHFHNPLRPWDIAGLDDYFLGHRTGQSQVIWAQNPSQEVGGKWSWNDARRYFHIALTGRDLTGNTVAANKEGRERYFADTFRAVGQLMHLVQDASVPEHVRNDIHILPGYEAEIENIRLKKPDLWGSWISNPVTYNKSIMDNPPPSPASVPISWVVDSDNYNGQNPEAAVSSIGGISEYANANFLSPDTMFTNDYDPSHRHYFPYPKGSSAYLWTDTANNRLYLSKDGEGDAIKHLAVVSFLYKSRLRYFPQYTFLLPVGLDQKVYEEYGSRLIPRAVGYSAGILKYFFRGQVEVLPPDQNGIKVKNTSDEEMDGAFTVYYDATDGTRKPVSGGSWTLTLSSGVTSGPLDFEEPDDIAEAGRYILVFRGRMGIEPNAVSGKVFSLKYHWTIVGVDFQPYDRYKYQYTEMLGARNDCGTSVGHKMNLTWTDTCPHDGSVMAYLLASDQALKNVSEISKCGETLSATYLGQFSREELFSKLFYQIYERKDCWRKLADDYGNLVCALKDGTVAYPLENYRIDTRGGLTHFAFTEISTESNDVAQIRDDYYPGKEIRLAFRSDEFMGGGYGVNITTTSFDYEVTQFLDGRYCKVSSNESGSCYYYYRCAGSSFCVNSVGIIPESCTTTRYVPIEIPDAGFSGGLF